MGALTGDLSPAAEHLAGASVGSMWVEDCHTQVTPSVSKCENGRSEQWEKSKCHPSWMQLGEVNIQGLYRVIRTWSVPLSLHSLGSGQGTESWLPSQKALRITWQCIFFPFFKLISMFVCDRTWFPNGFPHPFSNGWSLGVLPPTLGTEPTSMSNPQLGNCSDHPTFL